MTQALLPLPNVAIPGVGRCNTSEVEGPKIRECPGSPGRLAPQPARVEMGMVGESELQQPKSKAEKIQEGLERTIRYVSTIRLPSKLHLRHRLELYEGFQWTYFPASTSKMAKFPRQCLAWRRAAFLPFSEFNAFLKAVDGLRLIIS